jgi:acyl carrier protein
VRRAVLASVGDTVARVPALDEFVLETLAMACNAERSLLTLETGLDEIGLDSLSLTAVVAQIEAVYGCRFESEDVVELFQAAAVRDVVLMIRRMIGAHV